MKILGNLKRLMVELFFVSVTVGSTLPEAVYATTLGGMLQNLATDLKSVPTILAFGGMIVGVFFVISGIIKLQAARASGEDKSNAMLRIVIGFILVGGLGTFIAAGSGSVFGSASSSSTINGLNNP